MSPTIQWCDGPTPSANRPPATACTDNAWRASATGCCAWRGTTAVPNSIVVVRPAISATMVSASKSLGTCGIHAVSSPADSAHSMSETSLATLRAESPRSAPIITPSRIRTPPVSSSVTSLRRLGSNFAVVSRSASRLCLLGQGPHVANERLQRGAGRKHRGRTDVQQLLYVGLWNRATYHDGDVTGVGRP